jgi:hypothetical protein
LALTALLGVVVSGATVANATDDHFDVVFNGQAALQLGVTRGDFLFAPTSAGATWGGATANGSLSGAILGGGPLVSTSGTDLAFFGGSCETHYLMSNEYTRFGFTATGSTALGAFKARIEADFAGGAVSSVTDATPDGNFDSSTRRSDIMRLRHAYGEVGPILAGQTNSLWSN